jgi:hypothetical protein
MGLKKKNKLPKSGEPVIQKQKGVITIQPSPYLAILFSHIQEFTPRPGCIK